MTVRKHISDTFWKGFRPVHLLSLLFSLGDNTCFCTDVISSRERASTKKQRHRFTSCVLFLCVHFRNQIYIDINNTDVRKRVAVNSLKKATIFIYIEFCLFFIFAQNFVVAAAAIKKKKLRWSRKMNKRNYYVYYYYYYYRINFFNESIKCEWTNNQSDSVPYPPTEGTSLEAVSFIFPKEFLSLSLSLAFFLCWNMFNFELNITTEYIPF